MIGNAAQFETAKGSTMENAKKQRSIEPREDFLATSERLCTSERGHRSSDSRDEGERQRQYNRGLTDHLEPAARPQEGEGNWRVEPIDHSTRLRSSKSDAAKSSTESGVLQHDWIARLRRLEECICELLIENQQLRMALIEPKAVRAVAKDASDR